MTKQDTNDNQDKSPSEALQESGIYVFMDDVTSESVKPIIEWILYENYISNSWNKLDMFVVSISILEIILDIINLSNI